MPPLPPQFREIWAADFEFSQPPGEAPTAVHCLVAVELRSGRELRLWADELAALPAAPFHTGPDSLLVAYYASAEIACFDALGWPHPVNILDLYVEFRALRNTTRPGGGRGLLAALAYFGLPTMGGEEKTEMRDLAIRGGPFTAEERAALVDYCAADCYALRDLLPCMAPTIDFPRAGVRGRYMAAMARMEANGIPVDVDGLQRLLAHWPAIQEQLVVEVDADFGVYDGTAFKLQRFADYLRRHDILWPTTETGLPATDQETLREFSKIHPQLAPLADLRSTLGQMRSFDLRVGKDSRARCMLSAFASRTGRNQPSTSRFMFSFPKWLRRLVKPAPGRAVAYIDWSSQEFAVAAVLSGDKGMAEAYESGDPYLALAKRAGAVPADATKETHPAERAQFKAVVLGLQYGMGYHSLSLRAGVGRLRGYQLERAHREAFPTYWAWSEQRVLYAAAHGKLVTNYGWPLHVEGGFNARSVANFPMQAHGAEMLRLAAIMATEAGIMVCAPVHDAFLMEAATADIAAAVEQMRGIMAEAGRRVLDGFEVRTDADIVRYPDRYDAVDGRVWEIAWKILHQIDQAAVA